MIQDHYLVVKEWSPMFKSCEKSFGRTMVWIKFTGLNVMFYDESAMRTIASVVGRLVSIDVTMKTAEHGKFARACVEIDLLVLVTRKVWAEDRFHSIEFESLHLICEECDCYGHVLEMECRRVENRIGFEA